MPALRQGGERRESLRDAARIEAGLRAFLDEGGFGAFTDTFEDLHGLKQLPGLAVQRLMADGYGFGAEGDWKTAALVRSLKVMATGLPGGTSFMEDYTYHLDPAEPKVLGAHMLEVCPSIAAEQAVAARSIRWRSAAKPTRCGSCSRRRPARPSSLGLLDLGDRFRLVVNEVDVVDPDAGRCRSCRSRGRSGSRSPTSRRPPRRGSSPAARTTRSSRRRSAPRLSRTSPRSPGIELVVIDADTRLRH